MSHLVISSSNQMNLFGVPCVPPYGERILSASSPHSAVHTLSCSRKREHGTLLFFLCASSCLSTFASIFLIRENPLLSASFAECQVFSLNAVFLSDNWPQDPSQPRITAYFSWNLATFEDNGRLIARLLLPSTLPR